MTEIDIDYLRGWVGRERVREELLAPFAVQALSATLDREQVPMQGETLPPTWQWLYFNDCAQRTNLGADGHGRTGGFLPPVPLPRRMWASGEFMCERPLRIGELAEQRSVVTSVELKQGKTGALVFVSLEHQISQRGRRCLVEKQHLVYREMANGPSPSLPGEPAPDEADVKQPFQPDPVLLFRYSALTFNGHRIHYDRDYATWQEHYPALVVHGPLLATLLAEQVTIQMPEVRVSSFGFRAVRPVFDTDHLLLCSKRSGDRVDLWTQNQDGFVTMIATANVEVPQ
ncbi:MULTISPECIES: MaoC family dehydratase N-terminal domain-containing protein [unclassified Pseudomonas]|uniref:FAS1-like dehydratase domain-containing protein n=1 Tax=unclassified Pseudomonas TaxID=196821 RepID=UPI000876D60A|nr:MULTISPECIES: MaoC family dehydratase N-terminal domain-containing protein [unclassified Pseudomonas]SCZ20665.1 3-methylfumaryl-CoA hydratase [Pseudomonas sp. NFACC44-2]SDA43997.1 3-methylfumaryl-CoA hydratase [Pseudomonas sp. NFACC51]SFH09653.1 3-methylfumaryl-CoA hydratase [Pseudomonas sp. NFACC54]SFS43508.1 3-methylfumaryl-CoA hydratase [Pseudomonas sp. NFACC48-1]